MHNAWSVTIVADMNTAYKPFELTGLVFIEGKQKHYVNRYIKNMLEHKKRVTSNFYLWLLWLTVAETNCLSKQLSLK